MVAIPTILGLIVLAWLLSLGICTALDHWNSK